MLSLPSSLRVFIAAAPVDLRRGFDGLSLLVRQVLAADPLSGHLFVFLNRRGDRAKVLFWTRSGFTLIFKRLERGRFYLPRDAADAVRIEIDAVELQLLLEGIDLRGAHKRPGWSPQPARW